ncbi:MAG: ABC transporter permease, partial [Anaerolineae bacterium]
MNRPPTLTGKIVTYTVLVLMALFALYPIWFAILASGRPGDRLYTLNLAGMFVPTEWTWENYRVLLTDKPFLTWIKNSLVIATSTSVLSIFLGTSAAFAFS